MLRQSNLWERNTWFGLHPTHVFEVLTVRLFSSPILLDTNSSFKNSSLELPSTKPLELLCLSFIWRDLFLNGSLSNLTSSYTLKPILRLASLGKFNIRLVWSKGTFLSSGVYVRLTAKSSWNLSSLLFWDWWGFFGAFCKKSKHCFCFPVQSFGVRFLICDDIGVQLLKLFCLLEAGVPIGTLNTSTSVTGCWGNVCLHCSTFSNVLACLNIWLWKFLGKPVRTELWKDLFCSCFGYFSKAGRSSTFSGI